mmetsp:Transcript_13827/g.52625  ORF Transcript_13827/g.52625 Transcript_13827/m.52625 type:complete len:281 (-) Transcript_13827:1607-2449(-)
MMRRGAAGEPGGSGRTLGTSAIAGKASEKARRFSLRQASRMSLSLCSTSVRHSTTSWEAVLKCSSVLRSGKRVYSRSGSESSVASAFCTSGRTKASRREWRECVDRRRWSSITNSNAAARSADGASMPEKPGGAGGLCLAEAPWRPPPLPGCERCCTESAPGALGAPAAARSSPSARCIGPPMEGSSVVHGSTNTCSSGWGTASARSATVSAAGACSAIAPGSADGDAGPAGCSAAEPAASGAALAASAAARSAASARALRAWCIVSACCCSSSAKASTD